MHLKRQKAPKSWPISRKGTKYVVTPNFNIKAGVPVLIVLRDILKVAQNRSEVKKAICSKHILLNNKIVKDDRSNVLLFDKITIIPSKKYYELNLSNLGKFEMHETKEENTHNKIAKVIDKKVLKGKKTQLNLSDGRNSISNVNCKVNDSVIFDFKDGKITKCLPLKEKSKVIVFAGKHIGEKGEINKIDYEKKMVELEIDQKIVNVLIKQIIVVA